MLKIEEKISGQSATLKIFGEMIDSQAIALSEKVKALFVKEVKYVFLDLSEVNLMNSCFGLGILMACWGCANKSGGKLSIVNPSEKVSQLLKITKLDQVIEIAASNEWPGKIWNPE